MIMKSRPIDDINRRLDFVNMVLEELAMALPPEEAARAVRAIGHRVVQHLASGPVSETADEAIAADLAPILSALKRH
jgi:hypothetical protein